MMQARELYYDPLPYQESFHESRKPMAYLSAGYGAGKTYSLCMKAFQLMHENAGLAGGLLAPDLKMFKRDVLPTLRQICLDNNIPYRFHKTEYYFHFPDTDSTIYVFHAEDDGDSIRGPNLAFFLINEVTLISKGAFDAAIARVRLKHAKLPQVAMSGTPEGFNWAYEYFIESPRTDTDLVFGDMRLNTHISEAYAKRLEQTYDAKMIEQFVEGKFVNLTGNRALYAFDRVKHSDITNDTKIEKIAGLPVWVSLDFNVNPMSATLWNRMPATSRFALQGFDEVCIDSADTYDLAAAIRSKISSDDVVILYPDPAGKAASTKGRNLTDIGMLQERGFRDIRFKPSIRSVRDCLNAANNLFDKNMVRVSSKCKNFIADAEQCVIKPGTHEIDKRDTRRSHWLDGFKNMADYEFPAKKPERRPTTSRQI